MFGKTMVADMISRSAENDADRRAFLRTAGLAGMGAVGASTLLGAGSTTASAQTSAGAISDGAVLNFALNLEYLEAEFYTHAVFGHGLDDNLITGKGTCGGASAATASNSATRPRSRNVPAANIRSGASTIGGVKGGRKVHFASKIIKAYANEIARDEVNHVRFLRSALGSAKVARPKIDLQSSFTAAARAAGLISASQTFDPYANENNFLLAAFIFEDVGVTAYKGAAPLISNKTYLEAAAGILAVEAYHAATIRSSLYERGLAPQAHAISVARDSLDGKSDDDQGIRYHGGPANIVPTDRNSIVYSRSAAQVLNVVYLTPQKTDRGGFFPAGVNGAIHISGANG